MKKIKKIPIRADGIVYFIVTMPKLFDLLPDDAKKELIADAKKSASDKLAARPHDHKNVSRDDSHHRDKRHESAHDKRHERVRPHDGVHNKRHEGARHKDDSWHNRNSPNNKRHECVPNFVAVDVETTGLDFKSDRVIEVGAVKFVGGKPAEEFSTFINPGAAIPDHITRLTHISDDDVRDAPKFADIAAQLLEFIGNLPLCGHQIEFDLTFINEELKRAGFPDLTGLQLVDTALFSRVLLQHVGRFSLKHACAETGVPLDNAHRALCDAKASGEVAVRLAPKLFDLPLDVRRALAAFAPGSMFKTVAVRSLEGVRYGVDLRTGLPSAGVLPKVDAPEQYEAVDTAEIERIFTSGAATNNKADGSSDRRDDGEKGGKDICNIIKGFHPRPAQKEMALGVTRALNDNGVLVAEAGTGTGKSLAYLVPAALHAVKNNCRVVVSTHTRNLQDQLINNDLPAAAALCGGGLRFSKLKGRNNYLCLNRFYKLLRGELGNLSPRERNAALPLIVWSQTTKTGDIEEQTFFSPKWFSKTWNLISADGLECAGRRCPHHSGCFLQRARLLAQTSHIVVINHALFYTDICSEKSFLGSVESIIFDEAHHLESSGHRHLRTELDTNRANGFNDRLQNLIQSAAAQKGVSADVAEFEKELKNHLKNIRKRAQDFLGELDKWARGVLPETEGEYQIPVDEDSLRKLLEPAVFDITLGDLQDTLRRFRQILGASDDKDALKDLCDEASSCSEQTSQMRADLQYLVAAKTEDHVFWVEGNRGKKWIKLCGVQLDISELLRAIWERCTGGVVFTSATLATGSGEGVSSSTDYFKRAVGLSPLAHKTETIILPSPYGSDQTLFGAFANCPAPDDPSFPQFAAQVVAAIHAKLGKNILALFTSNAMLNNVYNHLKSMPEVDKNNLLAQGLGTNRNTMLEEFKAGSGMILLGTDSFWEGVDVPGESCEAVIIPRLPFPVPTHPLTQALGKRMEELYGSSFFAYSVPEAIIKFRQGIGRLIRSAKDRGILAVLDNRIVTKGYGKQFVRAVASPVNVFDSVDAMVDRTRIFFETPVGAALPAEPESTIKYVPFEDM